MMGEQDLEEIYFAGVGLDQCILQSALDARSAFPSLDVSVIEDACVAINAEAGSVRGLRSVRAVDAPIGTAAVHPHASPRLATHGRRRR